MKDNITIYSPGNIVAVTVSSKMEILDIEIKDDVCTIEQKPLLEEMITSTINQAYEQMEANIGSKEKAYTDDESTSSSNTNANTNSGSNYESYNSSSFMENFDKVKDVLGAGGYDNDEKLKTSIADMMKDFKIEYKDGRPYCSMPMDMLDNEAIMNMMNMFNGDK